MKITQIRKVYAVQGMHCAFTDIVSFRGRYYLGFMEGPQHMVNSENCCMILSSLDGSTVGDCLQGGLQGRIRQ